MVNKFLLIFIAVITSVAVMVPFPVAAADSVVVRAIENGEKAVYLTFDDGPDNVNTLSVMETLMNYDASATFFFTGKNMERYPEAVKQVYDNGFTIGLHGYNHTSMTKLSAAGIKNDLESTNDVLESITGERSAIMRPPGGNLNASSKSTLAALGYTAYLWTIDPRDWSKSATDELVLKNIKENLKPGSIILLHASPGHKRAAAILPELIEHIKAEGYQMSALPDSGYKTVAAKPSTSVLLMNGNRLAVSNYTINGSDYVRLRDFAEALSGTEKQFCIRWNEERKQICIATNVSYDAPGQKEQLAKAGVRRAFPSSVSVLADGKWVHVSIYSINGNCYFNLDELAQTLGLELLKDSRDGSVSFSVSPAA